MTDEIVTEARPPQWGEGSVLKGGYRVFVAPALLIDHAEALAASILARVKLKILGDKEDLPGVFTKCKTARY